MTDPDWIKGFLKEVPTGVLAIADEGVPYVNANIFVYMECNNTIYLHSSSSGRLPSLTAVSRPASFVAYTMGRILPAQRAIDFSVEYASVVAFGDVALVEDEDEAVGALRALMAKYAPALRYGKDYEGISDKDLSLTGVHRFRIESWVAKRNKKPRDFPGAYDYPVSDQADGEGSDR